MCIKNILLKEHKWNEGLFYKISHGLTGSIFHNGESDQCKNLRETRAVGIKLEKLNKSFGSNHVLKDVDLDISPGETFSIIGPSGTGKTFIASGLCNEALKKGYKAYFRSMEQINETLIMKDITRSALIEYNKLLKAHLLVIDDIMMFALEKKQAVQLFNFINHLHERASFIVTTNKSPEDWVKMLDDEVIATALLDRILYRCEVVRLSGKSYRLQNRKSIFN